MGTIEAGVILVRQRRRINGGTSLKDIFRATIIMILSLCIVAGASFSAFVFWTVYPPNERSENADVVLVIAGATDGRHELGAKLAEKYDIKNYVVSNPREFESGIAYNHCRGEDQPKDTNTWCMEVYPEITSGEAQTFQELADEQNWDSALLVTSRPHSRRVKYFFQECTSLSEIKVANLRSINENTIVYQVFHELAGYLKFWITRPC